MIDPSKTMLLARLLHRPKAVIDRSKTMLLSKSLIPFSFLGRDRPFQHHASVPVSLHRLLALIEPSKSMLVYKSPTSSLGRD